MSDTCTNGHPMLHGDAFCGQCGAPPTPEAPPPPSPPGETTPEAERMPALACPEGHANPEGNLYCGTCGAMLTMTAPPEDTVGERAGAPATASKDRSTRRIWIGVGLVAVAIAAVVVVSNRDSGSDPSSDDSDSYVEEATTTTLISDLCTEELSQWMPYVTGPGSLTDAMAEFGAQAPEVAIIRDAYLKFNSNLYQVGRDDASNASYDLLAQECVTLGDRYEPGHLPPG